MGDRLKLFDDKETSLENKKEDKHILFSEDDIKNLIENVNQSSFYYKEIPS